MVPEEGVFTRRDFHARLIDDFKVYILLLTVLLRL